MSQRSITRSLGLNAYLVRSTPGAKARRDFCDRLHARFGADVLTTVLRDTCRILDVRVLNIATEAFEPHGTSASLMVAAQRDSVLAHLDKSHLSVHTYFDSHPRSDVSTLRLDFDVTSCGGVSPLAALDGLLSRVEPDVAIVDYRVRGHERAADGSLSAGEHLGSIGSHLSPAVAGRYRSVDCDARHLNFLHTRMCLRDYGARLAEFGSGDVPALADVEALIAELMRVAPADDPG